jgi:ABC-type lipoprotein export system ATPase subunit
MEVLHLKPPADQAAVMVAVARAFRSGGGLVNALEDASIAVGLTGTAAIMGPSGSGKTTLLISSPALIAQRAAASPFSVRILCR